MLAHTFAGSTLRSALGFESERAVFNRFRERRRREREMATAVELPASRPCRRFVEKGSESCCSESLSHRGHVAASLVEDEARYRTLLVFGELELGVHGLVEKASL